MKIHSSGFEIDPFVEHTPDLICIAGKDGYFKKLNKAVIERLGYTEAELMSRPIFSFMHPDDRELTGKEREKLLQGTPLVNFQNRYIKKNGEVIWLHWTSIYLPEQEVVFAIAKDVTERKKLEWEIEEKYKKFKNLASHFKYSLEKDRKNLAMELHEELAQLAAVVKMDIDWLGANITNENPDVSRRMEHVSAISGLMINTIRRISFAISPDMIEDVGLNEAVKWLSREFTFLNGIPCHFTASYQEEELSHEAKLDFFRICQDALSNVAEHSGAKNVWIKIEDGGDTTDFHIEDDGKGFIAQSARQGFGFANIRERAASINAQLSIDSILGKGTVICVKLRKNLN